MDELTAERILEERYNEDNQLQYLIKWEGEEEEYATWESYDEVSSSWSHLLQMFNRQKRTKPPLPSSSKTRTDIIVIADDDDESGEDEPSHAMPIPIPSDSANDRYLRSKSAFHSPTRRGDYYKEAAIPFHVHHRPHHHHHGQARGYSRRYNDANETAFHSSSSASTRSLSHYANRRDSRSSSSRPSTISNYHHSHSPSMSPHPPRSILTNANPNPNPNPPPTPTPTVKPIPILKNTVKSASALTVKEPSMPHHTPSSTPKVSSTTPTSSEHIAKPLMKREPANTPVIVTPAPVI